MSRRYRKDWHGRDIHQLNDSEVRRLLAAATEHFGEPMVRMLGVNLEEFLRDAVGNFVQACETRAVLGQAEGEIGRQHGLLMSALDAVCDAEGEVA